MRAFILAGGEFKATRFLKKLAAESELVIAADSGLSHAKSLGVMPDMIVGDFDSLPREVLEDYPNVYREKYFFEKDKLDLEIAIDIAKEKGAKKLTLAGVLGNRLDQSLAAIFISARMKSEGFMISLHSSQQDVYPIIAGEEMEFDASLATTFSLLSLEKVSKVSVLNAKYPLENFPLSFGFGLGVSNEVTSLPLLVKVSTGLVVLVLERIFSDSKWSSHSL